MLGHLPFVLLALFSSLSCPVPWEVDPQRPLLQAPCLLASGWVQTMVGTGRRLGWEEGT